MRSVCYRKLKIINCDILIFTAGLHVYWPYNYTDIVLSKFHACFYIDKFKRKTHYNNYLRMQSIGGNLGGYCSLDQ